MCALFVCLMLIVQAIPGAVNIDDAGVALRSPSLSPWYRGPN